MRPLDLHPRGFLFFRQLVRRELLNGEPRIIVEHCQYTFSFSDDPAEESAWVFRYEYNRPGTFDRHHSHFHINGIHPHNSTVDFRRIHFPTERLSIELILAHLIIEHNVQPRDAGALELLAKSHADFSRHRTDLIDPMFP